MAGTEGGPEAALLCPLGSQRQLGWERLWWGLYHGHSEQGAATAGDQGPALSLLSKCRALFFLKKGLFIYFGG